MDRIDRYIVEGVLGEGAMGRVLRVRHADLGTLHALKLLTLSAELAGDRFLQEARIQAHLRHPNVVGVTDFVRADGLVGIVMELVEGVTLERLIGVHRLTVAQIDATAAALFDGIEAAHQLGLVHRDLKPENVMMQITPSGLVPRIMDFGLAKAADAMRVGRATRPGTIMGTPQFMAPEQYRDASAVDSRADLYSLGAILYELVSGRPAIASGDLPTMMRRCLQGEHIPLGELAPKASPGWIDAVEGLLALDPRDRPPDIATLRTLWGPVPHPEAVWAPAEIEALRNLPEEDDDEDEDEDDGTPEEEDDVEALAVALREETGGDAPIPETPPPPPPRPTRRRLWLPALAAVVVGTALLGTLAGLTTLAVFASTSTPTERPPSPQPEPVDAPPPPPVPQPEPPPEPVAVTAPPPSPAPVRVAVPVPEPPPAPPPTPTAPAAAPEPSTRIVLPDLDGYLVGEDGARHPLVDPPPGTYGVWVFFDNQKASLATQVTVARGQTVRLRCDALGVCR